MGRGAATAWFATTGFGLGALIGARIAGHAGYGFMSSGKSLFDVYLLLGGATGMLAVGHSILAVAGVSALLLLLVAGRPSRPVGGAQSAAVTLQR